MTCSWTPTAGSALACRNGADLPRSRALLLAAAALRDLLDADTRARERQPNRTVNECLSALRETLI